MNTEEEKEEHGKTREEFEKIIASCRSLFAKKLHDYGSAWRILRIPSVTDQLFIKACRIRSLQEKGQALIDEDAASEFVAIVNYSIVGLIQLRLGAVQTADLDERQALALYDEAAEETLQLMLRKNHDYGEAWRGMRVSSYTDLILMKLYRTKQIEDLDGKTWASEGIGANYQDMMNYAVFALIKLTLEHANAERQAETQG